MIETKLRIATVDSCFELVGSRQHGVSDVYTFRLRSLAYCSFILETHNRVSVKPGTPRNTPGTPLGHPIIPRNTPRTPKIVVSSQTALELTKPKTSEDSQLFIRLLGITLIFPSISRMLRNIFEAFNNSERTII